MRIAIATDGHYVSEHFGRCPFYTIADIDNGELKGRNKLNNPGHYPGLIPKFLKGHGVEYIIAGGMGKRAQDLFKEYEIKTILGVEGTLEKVINNLCRGELKAGESLCQPGKGRGYGLDKSLCDHNDHKH